MPIVSYDKDMLPYIPSQVSVELAPHVIAGGSVDTQSREGILRDISGCVGLIGPIQVCYDLNLSIPSAAISLKVGPVTVISGEISPDHPCLTLKGSYGIAKWDLSVCLRIPQKAITLEGTACATFAGCKSFNITLFHWGNAIITEESEESEEGDADVGANYPAYQCYKTQGRAVYCSRYRVKNHDEGAAWVRECLSAHPGDPILGRPYLAVAPPGNAIQWP